MEDLYAFWSYDLFPYLLGGKIVKIQDDGRVECDGWGAGYHVTPLFFLPGKTGANLLSSLKGIEAEREKAKKEFEKEWRKKLLDMLPPIVKKAMQ